MVVRKGGPRVMGKGLGRSKVGEKARGGERRRDRGIVRTKD